MQVQLFWWDFLLKGQYLFHGLAKILDYDIKNRQAKDKVYVHVLMSSMQ